MLSTKRIHALKSIPFLGAFHKNTAAIQAETDLDKTAVTAASGKMTDRGVLRRAAFSVAVLAAKGGAGASTLALNLAIALGKNGASSALVDADLQQPSLGIMIGKEPKHSIADLIARRNEADESIWNACRMPIFDEGAAACNFLSGPLSGDAARQVNLTQLAESLDFFNNHADFIVLDLPKNLDRHLVALTDRIDLLIIVFDGTLSAIAAAKRWKNIFAELGYAREKVLFLHNRRGAKAQDCQNDLRTLLGETAGASLPNAFSFLENCCIEGRPALLSNPKHAYARAVDDLSRIVGLLKTDRAARAADSSAGSAGDLAAREA